MIPSSLTSYELQIPAFSRPSRLQDIHPGVIIIDNGSYELRAGFASNPSPLLRFPNQLIKPRSRWTNDLETVVGDRNVPIKGFDFGRAAVRSPFDSNVIVNFETEEAILDYAFDRLGFQTPLDAHPLMMTESLLNPMLSRNTMLELLFESYATPNVLFVPDCLAAYYYNWHHGHCKADGMLLSSGHSASHVVPIVNGEALLFHAQRSKVCGYQATLHLQQLALLHNPQCAGSLSRRNVELMKEQCTICSQDYFSDLEKIQIEEQNAGGLGMKVQLPRASISPNAGNEAETEVTAVDKDLKLEEQTNRLKVMSEKRKQKLIQEKQDLLKYFKEIQVQIRETDSDDDKQCILADAEVDSEEELQKVIDNTEASIERLTAPSATMSQSKATSNKKPKHPAGDITEIPTESVESVKARYKSLTEKLESKKRGRLSGVDTTGSGVGSKRVSVEQRRRMKLVAEAAAVDEDDDFGADERDWDVYKEMDPHYYDSDLEKQTLAEVELARNKLRDLGEKIEDKDVFGKDLGVEGALDENQVYLSVERIRIPELLFQPCLMGFNQAGIPEIISKVLKSLPVHLAKKCDKEILISGGNMSFVGLEQRLATELCSLSPLGQPMTVIKAMDCFLDSWRGVALLAQQPDAFQHSYSIQEYYEIGVHALKRKQLPFVHNPTAQ